MKYKVGDIVKVCEYPPENKKDDPGWCSPFMDDYCGLELEILKMLGSCLQLRKDPNNPRDSWYFNESWVNSALTIQIQDVVYDFGVI